MARDSPLREPHAAFGRIKRRNEALPSFGDSLNGWGSGLGGVQRRGGPAGGAWRRAIPRSSCPGATAQAALSLGSVPLPPAGRRIKRFGEHVTAEEQHVRILRDSDH